MRILHLCYDHPDNPWCGGGGAGRTWQVNRLLAARHDITVCCGAFPGAGPRGEPFRVRVLGRARRYVESRLAYIFHSRRLDLRPYDLVVEEFSYYAPVFARFAGRPVVTILQGRHGMDALRARGVYGLVSLVSEYLLLPRRRAVIIDSPHLAGALHPAARTAVIGLGTDPPPDLPPRGEDQVLFVGRLDVWHKGIDTLIAAWAGLDGAARRWPLVLVGGGDAAAVAELVRRHGAADVILRGRVDHADVLRAMRRAAFVVMPSRMEGFGLVAAEALAAGAPAIVSAIPSLAAIVPHGEAGLQVPPADPAALCRAMGRLATDDALRRRLAAGAARIGVRFSWREIAAAQEVFYREVLTARRQASRTRARAKTSAHTGERGGSPRRRRARAISRWVRRLCRSLRPPAAWPTTRTPRAKRAGRWRSSPSSRS